jgi:hypothetical protein
VGNEATGEGCPVFIYVLVGHWVLQITWTLKLFQLHEYEFFFWLYNTALKRQSNKLFSAWINIKYGYHCLNIVFIAFRNLIFSL